MNHVTELFSNYILICAVIAWFSAQAIKLVIGLVQHRSFNFTILYSAGGMPSSHSSTVCATACSTALTCGLASPEFALAVIFAFVVMYDAAGVRRAAGEQAKILNRIVADLEAGQTRYMTKNLKELLGHTPLEVFVGALLGILIPFLVRMI
ncbi:MAG: divergent PAP2 family protein [Clostridia bacterium]|nr:divergent PAP2 family protein [Clostridia bacterium]